MEKLDQYNPDGENNAQYSTVDRMPSQLILNIKASYTLMQKIQLQLGIEKIPDGIFRYFASGFTAPILNVIAALRVNF